MKILITGVNGLLGQKLLFRLASEQGIQIIATGRGEDRNSKIPGQYTYRSLNVTDREAVRDFMAEVRPDCVVHTAAMTQVDDCEKDENACRLNNIEAVRFVAEACEPWGTHFIHLSTDFIFDGKSGPYSEIEALSPLSIYGHSKAEAEQIVQKYAGPWTIIRTVLVYGLAADMSRSNIVLWVKKSLEEGKAIRIVSDQFRTPTLAEDLAEGCVRVALRKATGIYNISGGEYMSVLEMARRIAKYFNLNEGLIESTTTAILAQPAARPLRSGFVIDKAKRDLEYRPHTLEEGITMMMKQFEDSIVHDPMK
jgi:dTDP-4-dehydrorhamnose reductase